MAAASHALPVFKRWEDLRPVNGCDPGYIWSDALCQCVWDCTYPNSPQPATCFYWSSLACSWIDMRPLTTCDSGYIWDDATCRCIWDCTYRSSPQPDSCSFWSTEQCQWVSLQPAGGCGPGYKWDEATCRCIQDCAEPPPGSQPPGPCYDWIPEVCDWVSRQPAEGCAEGYLWDEGTCSCKWDCSQPNYATQIPGCYEWDPSSCEWISMQPAGGCGPGYKWDDSLCKCVWDCTTGPDPGKPQLSPCTDWNPATCDWVEKPRSPDPGVCYTYDMSICDWTMRPLEYDAQWFWATFPSPELTIQLKPAASGVPFSGTPGAQDVFLSGDDRASAAAEAVQPPTMTGTAQKNEIRGCASPQISTIAIAPTVAWAVAAGGAVMAEPNEGDGIRAELSLTGVGSATVTFTTKATSDDPDLDVKQSVGAVINTLKLETTPAASPDDHTRTAVLPGEVVTLNVTGSPAGVLGWTMTSDLDDPGTLSAYTGSTVTYKAPLTGVRGTATFTVTSYYDGGTTSATVTFTIAGVEIKTTSPPYSLLGFPLGPVNNLAAEWPGAPLDLIVQLDGFEGDLPLGAIRWYASEHSIPDNATSARLVWATPGSRTVVITIGELSRKVHVNSSDVGTISLYELSLLDLMTAFSALAYAIAAENWSKSALPGVGEENAMWKPNALKHSCWNALLASDPTVGPVRGINLTTAYEYTHRFTAPDSAMDLHNNYVGSTAVHTKFLIIPDEDAIHEDLLNRLARGELWIVERVAAGAIGHIIKSNEEKMFPIE